MFCEAYEAIKNHYFLIQIGHMISQLLEYGLRTLEALSRMPSGQLIANVKEAFRNAALNDEDEQEVKRRCRYRFQ